MLNKIKNIFKKDLFRTSILTSASTIIKIISTFVVQKIIAIQVGPSGIAILAQLQNFIAILTTTAGLGTNQGIVKYISEYKESNKEKLRDVLSTSNILTFVSALVVALFSIIFSSAISVYLFNTEEYSLIIKLISTSVIFYSFYTQFISYLNGFNEVKKYAFANIVGNLISLIITVLIVLEFGLFGALLSVAITQTIMFFTILYFSKSSEWFTLHNFNASFNKLTANKLFQFSFIALTNFILTPYIEILIRNHIFHHFL